MFVLAIICRLDFVFMIIPDSDFQTSWKLMLINVYIVPI